jgi:hypothetical protein
MAENPQRRTHLPNRFRATLLRVAILHYNRWVHRLCPLPAGPILVLLLSLLTLATAHGQQAPPPSGARVLLMPRKLITGERATLAVLDMSGRLTPGVDVKFSDGEKVTTDTTGRALFVAPLNPGTISAAIAGRNGRVTSSILSSAGLSSAIHSVNAAPRLASLSDRFELAGEGFCGDADANHVQIGGMSGLVLASSPASLIVLPPADLETGPSQVKVSCGQKVADPFTIVFVSLELEAKSGSLTPGEHRSLVVRVRGTTGTVNLEARNLSPKVADLSGGAVLRATSSGGADNIAKFEVVGKTRGNFTISIRLLAPLAEPQR